MNITERYFFLYLLTNPHTSQIGCYEITSRQIQFETGLAKEEIESCLEIIKYSKSTNELLIKNWYKYNLTKSPKMFSYIKKELKNVKTIEFRNYIETVCIPYIYGIDTVSIAYKDDKNEDENNQNIRYRYGIYTASQ